MNATETLQAMRERHSVRSYDGTPLTADEIAALQDLIDTCNEEGGLHIQLVVGEPKAFSGGKARYGKFSGVVNYLAFVGPKGAEERIGYYGEKIVLRATQLGLGTCWVALTFSKVKGAYEVGAGERLHLVAAIGHGTVAGAAHKVRPVEDVSSYDGDAPEWFTSGVEAALLAPTAMNQQKFRFEGEGNAVRTKAGLGFYTKIDLGIAKYHFEIGAGEENFVWAS